ncbi:hypothetical protein Tco_0227065 [Tanacetum coccineum]
MITITKWCRDPCEFKTAPLMSTIAQQASIEGPHDKNFKRYLAREFTNLGYLEVLEFVNFKTVDSNTS